MLIGVIRIQLYILPLQLGDVNRSIRIQLDCHSHWMMLIGVIRIQLYILPLQLGDVNRSIRIQLDCHSHWMMLIGVIRIHLDCISHCAKLVQV